MQFCVKCILFSTISETSSCLQASGSLQSIDHIHSTGKNTLYTGLSKFVLLLRQKENVFGTESPPQMPSDYIINLAGRSTEAGFILGSALCQCSRVVFNLQET